MTQGVDTQRTTVLVVGPPPSMMGGMARVVEQVVAIRGDERFRIVPFETTSSRYLGGGLLSNITRHFRHVRLLRRTIRKHRAAAIHIHTCSGFSFFRSAVDMFAARREGCRTILHIHGAKFDEFYDRAGVLTRRIIRSLLSRADRVLALSQSWKVKLSAMSPGARISVIENAADIPSDVSSHRDGECCQFALLAKMDVWKGIDDLLAACAILRGDGLAFRVVMAGPAGSAGDDASLNTKIVQLDLVGTVSYVGPLRGDAKGDLLRASHVYVQPSHHEGMPLSILEAMAQALPIVATRVGAVPEVLKDGREGILVSPRKPGMLADAMRRLIVDRTLRRRMAKAAHTLAVERFSLDRFRREILTLYGDLCAPTRFDRTWENADGARAQAESAITTS